MSGFPSGSTGQSFYLDPLFVPCQGDRLLSGLMISTRDTLDISCSSILAFNCSDMAAGEVKSLDFEDT